MAIFLFSPSSLIQHFGCYCLLFSLTLFLPFPQRLIMSISHLFRWWMFSTIQRYLICFSFYEIAIKSRPWNWMRDLLSPLWGRVKKDPISIHMHDHYRSKSCFPIADPYWLLIYIESFWVNTMSLYKLLN